MSDTNKLFDQHIHDAYERVELSGDAQERMLAALLAAQAERAEAAAKPAERIAPVAAPTATQEETEQEARADGEPAQVELTAVPRRRRVLPAWAALAAALLVATIVVRVSGVMDGWGSGSADSAAAPAESAATDEGVSYDAESLEDKENRSISEEMAPQTDADVTSAEPTAVELYPSITLADGTHLTALEDSLYPRELDASQVGDSLGEATATSFDPGKEVTCEVFALVDDSTAFAVRYPGEDTYWRCTKD